MDAIYAVLFLFGIGMSPANSANQPSTPPADNVTIKNDRDDIQTPIDEATTKADKKLSAAIRKAISSESLSKVAQNIRIIVRDGAVTLRGLVYSSLDKTRLGLLAQQVPDVRTVENRVLVKIKNPPGQKSYLTETTYRRPVSVSGSPSPTAPPRQSSLDHPPNLSVGIQLPQSAPIEAAASTLGSN